jgi:hypothetical protein
MRVFIPDMPEFFAWMEQAGLRHVVLRNADAFLDGYPRPGTKDDVDLLVEDAALAPIRLKYGRYGRRQGVKCDVYDVSGSPEGAYQGKPYYPAALAGRLLASPVRFHDRFLVAEPKAFLHGLMYHVAYHKAERSKIDRDDPALSLNSKYVPELRRLMAAAGVDVPLTLNAFHRSLAEAGCGPDYDQLAAILTNDFSRNVKSPFLAGIFLDLPGELNLFVIREVVARQGMVEGVADRLRAAYTVLAEKDIPWLVRVKTRKGMRGGKWRRGGMPMRALVVFDPEPVPTTDEDRQVHPLVFNSRQFMKRELREWFAETTGLHTKHNPLHSTDNEAEALGHLALFFTPEECEALYRQLHGLRRKLQAAA